jgi:large repetitive protein
VGGTTTDVSVPGGCGPSVSTPTGTPAAVDVGQSVVFQATLTGVGSGGDTFDWGSLAAGLNCTSSTTDSIPCRPTAPGTYSVAVTVTDSDGHSSTSGTLHFPVDSDPVAGAPHGSPATAETGVAVTFTASPSGGSGNFTFIWAHLPSPCTATSSASPICHPATAGVYPVSVNVTDSNGYEVRSSVLDYTVTAGPTVGAPVAKPTGPIEVGESVNFSVTANGGEGPYTYTWQALPTGCSSVNAPSLACRPTAAGNSSITVSVTDSVGGQVTSAPLAFSVRAALEIGSVSASSPEIDLGGTVTFSALNVSGGYGLYSYSWSSLPPGCAPADSASVACAPSGTGTFSPNVTVRDAAGGNVTASTHLAVVADPSVGGIDVSRSSSDVDQPVSFSAHGVSGGVGGYSYAWTGLPTGCASANATTLPCTPAVAGNVSVTVTVTDADHFSGVFTIGYSVYPLPNVATPTVSPPSAAVGETFHLTSNATPGSGNLTYVWGGLPPGCPSVNRSTLGCTPTANGTFLVVVTVRDSNGGSATSSALSLAVAPRPVSPPSSSPPTGEYILIGGLVVLGAVAVLLAGARWRKSRRPPSG